MSADKIGADVDITILSLKIWDLVPVEFKQWEPWLLQIKNKELGVPSTHFECPWRLKHVYMWETYMLHLGEIGTKISCNFWVSGLQCLHQNTTLFLNHRFEVGYSCYFSCTYNKASFICKIKTVKNHKTAPS